MTEFAQHSNRLEPEDYYHSEEGYLIFTEQYHLKRGYCCENGCLHCPYGFKKDNLSVEKEKENEHESDSKRNKL